MLSGRMNQWFELLEDHRLKWTVTEVNGLWPKSDGTIVSHSLCVEASWQMDDATIDHLWVRLRLSEEQAVCLWKPQLCPLEDMVIGDCVFRSPAIIFQWGNRMAAFIPDVDLIRTHHDEVPTAMDYVEPDRMLLYGLHHYKKAGHVYQSGLRQQFQVLQGQALLRFYLLEWQMDGVEREFGPVARFMWERYGSKRIDAQLTGWTVKDPLASADAQYALEQLEGLTHYARYTYEWAFHTWKDAVWHEFELDGRTVGGCVRQVRTFHSPSFTGEPDYPVIRSIWNQAWFSNLRSAYGYMVWGKRLGNEQWLRKGRLSKALALAAPQTDGLFPSVYDAGPEGDWKKGHWSNSNRRPPGHESYYHLLDMSWTCLWMLKWYEDHERDTELLAYAAAYADRLLRLQKPNGGYPAWVRPDSGYCSPYLQDSPEMAMHAWFLTRLYRITGKEAYLQSAARTMDTVKRDIISTGRWEDFETYWSCSSNQQGKQYGVKDLRSGLYNQCSFSIYWTAEAFKELYEATANSAYLTEAERTLAELSLYQAVWQPGFLQIPVFGGFGVMTSDDEWNDARQSLFAMTYLDFYRLTGKGEYLQRCLTAARASFYMMYCPENEQVKARYDLHYPYFSELDYGFMMENNYHGYSGEWVGNFTIFDWGNGSATSSLGELIARLSANPTVSVDH